MTATKARVLRPAGIEVFRSWLHSKLEVAGRPSLEDETITSTVSPEIDIDTSRTFSSRYEMGCYLVERLDVLKATKTVLDPGFWSWLSLAFIDQLTAGASGPRIGADDRFIPNATDQRRRIRHLVRTNYELVAYHGTASQLLLNRPLYEHGEDTEQLLGRRQLAINQSLFKALASLYLRSAGVARGARSKKGGGTYRRFGKVERQFNLTFDLQSMTPEEILQLLPKEFNRFRSP